MNRQVSPMKKIPLHNKVSFLFAAVYMLLLTGCTQYSVSYGVINHPAVSNDGKITVVLVAESRGTTYQVNGGYRATDYNTSYWLKQYENASGKLLKKKKIITNAEQQNILPLCYGGFGDKIWLHTSGLKAYSLSSLDEEVTEDQLAAENHFDKINFPADQRFDADNINEGYIKFSAGDGTKYIIDLSSLKIHNEKNVATHKKNSNTPQQLLHNAGRITLGVRWDTLNNNIFMLAKDSAAAGNSSPGNSEEGPVYKTLYLFTANFTTHSIGSHSFYSYKNLRRLPGAAYLNGFFLKDFGSGKIIKLLQPDAYIILHNDSLTGNARSVVSAVDTGNQILWQLNTGISTHLAGCTVKNNSCILTGNRHPIISPHIGSDMLCIINIKAGKLQTISLAD